MPKSFCTLFARCFKLEYREWVKFAVELTIIYVCFTSVAIIPKLLPKLPSTSTIPNISWVKQDDIEFIETFQKVMHIKRYPFLYKLAYAPNNSYTNDAMTVGAMLLSMKGKESYTSHSELDKKLDTYTMYAAVKFPEDGYTDYISSRNDTPDIEDAYGPKQIKIAICFPNKFRTLNADNMHDQLWMMRRTGVLKITELAMGDAKQPMDLYVREGFLVVQHGIFTMCLGRLLRDVLPVEVYAYYDRHHSVYSEVPRVNNFVRYFYCFSFLLPFLNLIYKYGREREENLLAHHWKFGYENRTYWLVHFICSLLRLFPLNCVALLVIKISHFVDPVKNTFFDSHLALALLFFFEINVAMILTAMCLVTVARNVRISILLGLILWLSFYVIVYAGLEERTTPNTTWQLVGFVMFFHSCFVYTLRFVEDTGEVVQSDEFWIICFALIGNMILTIILLTIAMHYATGRYMRRMPFDFLNLCKCCYTNRRKKKKQRVEKRVKDHMIALLQPPHSSQHFEGAPLKSTELMTLSHVFTHPDRIMQRNGSLKNVSFSIYEGEITCILGHHDAGKTTLISVMAGWMRPFAGQVLIDNEDIFADWKNKRSQIDVCMADNNPLFDLLTAEETLEYFMRIKMPANVEAEDVRMEKEKWMHRIEPAIMNPKMRVMKMSFEQKRVLCLCCALSCGTKIVLLDEPTVLMRGEETRYYWDILRHERAGRAIVLATYSVSEAEAIGDRVAVLSDGILQAYGTPCFLKHAYNRNYYVIILKDPSVSSGPITATLRHLIVDLVPESESEMGTQLVYMVPENHRSSLQKLLIVLEREMSSLNIQELHVFSGDFNTTYLALHKHHDHLDLSTREPPHHHVDRKRSTRLSLYQGRKLASCNRVDKAKAGKATRHMRAMFQRKVQHQAAWQLPIIVLLLSICIVIILHHYTKFMVLGMFEWHNQYIDLGFPPNQTDRALFDGLPNCSTVAIVALERGMQTHRRVNNRSFLFTPKSFLCVPKKPRKYLQSLKDLDKVYGIVHRNDSKYTVAFNQKYMHTAAITLNLAHNLMLHDFFPDDKEIVTMIRNDPTESSIRHRVNLRDNYLVHMRMAILFGIFIPLLLAMFITPLVHERRSQMLYLQVMSGLRMHVYWLINLVWDSLVFFTYCVIIVLFMCWISIEDFLLDAKFATICLLALYGLAGLTMVYFISLFCDSSPTSSYFTVVLIQLITGIWSYVIYWDIVETSNIYFNIASLFPTFTLLDGISRIYAAHKENYNCIGKCTIESGCNPTNMCKQLPQCCLHELLTFEDSGLLISITFLLISLTVFTIGIFCVHLWRTERKYSTPEDYQEYRTACYPYDDDDVVKMKRSIAEADMRICRKWRFVVDQLERSTVPGAIVLRTVSFATEDNECLGIYGSRKSGKTALMEKLAGIRKFCFGDVYILATELKFSPRTVMQHTSYCPQQNEAFDLLTPRQMMSYFCMIRGFPSDEIAPAVRRMAESLGMQHYMNRMFNTLLAEYKRKTLLAITIIVDTDFILLDEPTRGLRPFARKQVWQALRYASGCGKTIVFASNDPGECDALADKVVLYDDGEMWAIGSTHYLRHKFTQGFVLDIQVNFDGTTVQEIDENLQRDIDNVNRFVMFMHSSSLLRSRVGNHLKYFLPVGVVTYSFLFGSLEKHYQRLNIASYVVNQPTMEEVMAIIAETRTHRRPRLHR